MGDPVYAYLERLADLGLAPGYLRSMQPITIAYAVELVHAAEGLLSVRGLPEPAFLPTLRDEIGRLQAHDLRFGRAGGEAEVAVGSRDQVVEPAAYADTEILGRFDRSLLAESGAGLGAAGRLTLGRHVAAEVAVDLASAESGATATLRRGYLKLGLGALELEAGRDDLVWGQAGYRTLSLSGNAPAIDQVGLRTARPVRLPWLLRYLGGMQAMIFFGRLAQEVPPHRNPYLVGERLALKPFSWLEIGAAHLYAFGGEDYPFDVGRFFEELFGYRRDLYDFNFGSHSGSWDLRVSIPRWFDFYGIHYLDDCCSNVLGQDSSVLVGVRRPRVFSPRDDLAVEYAWVSRIAYIGNSAPDFSHHGYITGHPLGNRGTGVYLLWRYVGDEGLLVRTRLALERRAVPEGYVPAAPEWRIGGHLEGRLPLRGRRAGRVVAQARLALERVLNASHLPGDDRTAALLEVGVEAAF